MRVGSRRLLMALPLLALARPGMAQQAPAGLIGQWQGQVEGIGGVRLFVTAVSPNGQIQGRMEFDLQSFVSTFGDKADSAKATNHGVVSGNTVTIESALGGTYRLTLAGNRLAGRYTRGTTFDGAATFVKQ
jgi:hypothetical protein